jgi:cellulose synthase/poly-beta-1,6-N-acetylglucosamine synthase-like glycosyltransferase
MVVQLTLDIFLFDWDFARPDLFWSYSREFIPDLIRSGVLSLLAVLCCMLWIRLFQLLTEHFESVEANFLDPIRIIAGR